MGTECHCFNDPRDERHEFYYGTGKYSFKKFVYIVL